MREIGNTGNFKNKIDGLSDGCMLSLPTVITGSDYTLHSQQIPRFSISIFCLKTCPSS